MPEARSRAASRAFLSHRAVPGIGGGTMPLARQSSKAASVRQPQ